MWCEQCKLNFCSDLHGPHSSHSMQMIRPELRNNTDIVICMHSDMVVSCGQDQADSSVPSVPSFPSVLPSISSCVTRRSKKRDATEARLGDFGSELTGTVLLQPSSRVEAVDIQDSATINPTAITFQSSLWAADENPNSRRVWEDEKFQEAVSFIREQLNSGKANHESFLSKFKFASCYDISFLHKLAKEFNVNISDILNKRRVNHTDVLNALISKLLLS